MALVLAIGVLAGTSLATWPDRNFRVADRNPWVADRNPWVADGGPGVADEKTSEILKKPIKPMKKQHF